MFAVITIQQLCDKEDNIESEITSNADEDATQKESEETKEESKKDQSSENRDSKNERQNPDESGEKEEKDANKPSDDCDVCNESRIYAMFKNLRDKFSQLGEEM